ncbi:MAG: GNAT family N-acetyltransferase [Acidimicrobiales bacterium]
MPRLRLGVALLVPRLVGDEIDVLRRACGERAVERIPPHCTLVPPVNVRGDRLDDAVVGGGAAAAATRPFTVTLGPPTTFLPVNPVLYLAVGGDDAAVRALRHRVFVEPLSRSVTLAFHPHVTLVDRGEPEVLAAAVRALAGYRAEVTFSGVHLLQERRDDQGCRVWRPVADAAFAAPAVVGRGALGLELALSERLGPEATALSASEWAVIDHDRHGHVWPEDLAVTARRDGAVVGTAVGWTSGTSAYLGDLIVVAAHRGEGIGSHLVAAFLAAAIDLGCSRARVRT